MRGVGGERASRLSGLEGPQNLGEALHCGQEILGGVGGQGLEDQAPGIDADLGQHLPGPLHPPLGVQVALLGLAVVLVTGQHQHPVGPIGEGLEDIIDVDLAGAGHP